MNYKRVTLLGGHYGSGKTNVAVAMALEQAGNGIPVSIADLDIVNPYFRTEDSRDELDAAGIPLIVSPYANTNLDIPALPQEMYAVTDDRSRHFIVDVGGDDRGALALGRLTPSILEENDYDFFMVISRFRPLSRTPEDTVGILREIELAAGLPFTGIINNSNLGALTTEEDILSSEEYARAVAQMAGLPLVLTCAESSLYERLSNKVDNLFCLHLQRRPV